MSQYLDINQVTAVLRKAYKHDRRAWLMILLAWTHGLRRGEVAALKLSDVADGRIKVKRLKGSLATVHPLRESDNFLFNEKIALKAWLEERKGDTDALFPSRKGGSAVNPNSVTNLIARFMRDAGIPKPLAHSHSLKHACASYLIRNGVSVEYVRQWIGHKDIKNTINFYTHISDDEAFDKADAAFNSVPKS